MDELSKQLTLLIVDDARENINLLAEILKANFKIRVATSGEKALEISFSDSPPDLILLDIMMPEIDGYEVCKRLKASFLTKRIPVIFITGKTNEEDEIYGFSLGAVDYIAKPFSPIIVKARINTHAELIRYRDYLESISYLDGLTGIPNRRKFDEQFELMWNIAKRDHIPISIIMIDIDHFKLYNDDYGHQVGDECLIQVAQGLSEVIVRKTDLIARYGGEEFVCILPNTDETAAFLIAENLRNKIIKLQIPHMKGSDGNILTISLGVATSIPKIKDLDYSELIKDADHALYNSKKNDRNKTSIYTSRDIM